LVQQQSGARDEEICHLVRNLCCAIAFANIDLRSRHDQPARKPMSSAPFLGRVPK
jgi:hypothetical protein